MKLELKYYLDAFKNKTTFKITDLGIFNLDLEYPDQRYSCEGLITDVSTYNSGEKISGILTLKNGCFFDFDFKLDEDPEIKPILRPLSDLAKEIEVNGEKFVPIDVLYKIWNEKSLGPYSKQIIFQKISIYPQSMPYWLVQYLLEWHFDIYDLIKNGLATDINMLTK